ncbi:YybS family protein [Sporolituus thermophilus]|uniref:Uncharacterized conserved protein YybS, DUF2232 family n=1 Tax=Sporolituus thermophilus DSM 23256 TaxID=1123285 RepID=A0A1G7L0E7_9FIRM|nr:YybS family protein [Sporolituus thermophilus]SDF42968.1 Uncharacterized conserved protein YybS, DUF2232 family [Sporolituus thermophilus DSM 23256]
MRNTGIRPMVEGGVLAAVAIMFAFISAYIPIIGPFVNLIWPVPIILLGVRHGYKWSIMATIVAGIIIAILMHPLHAVSVVVGFGLIGIVLGHAFRAGLSPAKAIGWGAVASLVSKAAVLAIGAVFLGVNPLNIQGDVMTQAAEQAIDFYRRLGMKEEDLARMGEMLRTMLDLFKIILPAGFVLAAVVDTYLNFVVAKAVLGRLGHRIAPFPPFKEWTLPRAVLYAFIIAILAIYWGQSREIKLLYNAGVNLQMLSTVALLVQGMALFYFLADKYNLSRFVRGIILILIFSNGFLMQVVIFAGAFDMALDYRRLRSPHSM